MFYIIKLENLKPKEISIGWLTKQMFTFLKKGMRYQSQISLNTGFKKSAPRR